MLHQRLQDEIAVASSGRELKYIQTDRIERNVFGVQQQHAGIDNSGADEGGRRKKKSKRTRKN